MRNTYCSFWIMAKKKKQGKMWKMRNAHSRTWNMVRKLTNYENEKLTLQDMEYGEKV